MIARLILVISLFQFLLACKHSNKLESFLNSWQNKEIEFPAEFN